MVNYAEFAVLAPFIALDSMSDLKVYTTGEPRDYSNPLVVVDTIGGGEQMAKAMFPDA